MEAAQVRTKKRVSDHGKVLTGQREVNAMLDLVKQETERIDSRSLIVFSSLSDKNPEVTSRRAGAVYGRCVH
jgi:hypothetical protein